MVNLQKIPERIAFLTLLFLHKKITPSQHQELDDWIVASDENLALWEEIIHYQKWMNFWGITILYTISVRTKSI